MFNTPTRAESGFLPPSLARAFALVLLALVATGTANAFAQSPAAAAPPTGPTQATPAPPAQPAASGAQPAAPPYYYPAPPYYYPPPGYPPPQPSVPPAPRREPSFLVGSLALGGGTPYGMIGGGFTLGFDYLSIIAGAGSALLEGFGYGAGLRVHFLDTSHRWRPHFTAVYGTTCIYKVSDILGNVHWSGVLRGFGFYAGIDQDFGELGGWFATYGLGYITHEDLPASVRNAIGGSPDLGVPIDIIVAIGYRFGGQ